MSPEEYGEAYAKGGLENTATNLRRKGVPWQISEEIAQEAWVKGFEKLANFRGECSIRHWIGIIALNTYRTKLRNEKRRGLSIEIKDWMLLLHPESDQIIDAQKLLSLISPRQRSKVLFWLAGEPTTNVQRLVYLIKKHLRKLEKECQKLK